MILYRDADAANGCLTGMFIRGKTHYCAADDSKLFILYFNLLHINAWLFSCVQSTPARTGLLYTLISILLFYLDGSCCHVDILMCHPGVNDDTKL